MDMIKKAMAKPIFWITMVMLLFVGYVMMPVGATKDMLIAYDKVNTSKSASSGLKLQFLREYTLMTGDTKLAIAAGIDVDTANEWTTGSSDAGINNAGTSEPMTLTGDWSNQLNQLKTGGRFPLYISDNCELTSTGYYWEHQNKSKHKIKSNSGSEFGNVGCGFYAACMAKTYISKQIYTSLDLLKDHYNWTGIDAKTVTGTASISSWKFNPATVCSIIGLKSTNVDKGYSYTAGDILIVYGYSKTDTKKGNHWRCVMVTGDSTKPYYVLPNCNEHDGKYITEQEFGTLYTCGGEATENNGYATPVDYGRIYLITNK